MHKEPFIQEQHYRLVVHVPRSSHRRFSKLQRCYAVSEKKYAQEQSRGRSFRDVVNIGVGSGSVCTTRTKTGVGYPQSSAVIECAIAAHAVNGYISADGGCTRAGDFAKALGAGADFVMAGGIFTGHDQGGGEIIEKDGKRYCVFYGLSSTAAMNKHYGGVAQYRTAEGKTVEIPYRGDVETTILDILGGLRSACTYVGASRLRELPDRTTFVRCTQVLNTIFGS